MGVGTAAPHRFRRWLGETTRGYRRTDILLYVLVVAGEGVRLALPFLVNPLDHLWSDPGRWWDYATKTGIETPPLALIDPVFYQAWLSFVAKLTLDVPELVAAYTGILSAVTPWVWYRFFRELLPDDKRLALVGWAVTAWLPSWIGIYSYFMTETLLLPLLGLSLWLSWRSMRKGTSSAFLWASLVWALTGLTRGIAAPIAVAVMAFVWPRQKRRWLDAAAMTLLVGSVLVFSGYRSYAKSGTFSPLGQPYMNEVYAKSGKAEIRVNYYSSRFPNLGYSYGFSSPSINNAILAPLSDWVTSRQGTVGVAIDLENQRRDWTAALAAVEKRVPSDIGLRLENLVLLLIGPSWPDENPAHLFERLGTWMRFVWLPILALGLFTVLRPGVIASPGNRPLVLALLVWTTVQGFSLMAVNEGRYRKPGEGLMIAALLVGVQGSSRKGGRRCDVVHGHRPGRSGERSVA